jgi:hypothetical protein
MQRSLVMDIAFKSGGCAKVMVCGVLQFATPLLIASNAENNLSLLIMELFVVSCGMACANYERSMPRAN